MRIKKSIRIALIIIFTVMFIALIKSEVIGFDSRSIYLSTLGYIEAVGYLLSIMFVELVEISK